MNDMTDPVELATELASIASATSEVETARQLIEIVQRLLADAGLPPDDEGSGETRSR
jgi:hypothetical protein